MCPEPAGEAAGRAFFWSILGSIAGTPSASDITGDYAGKQQDTGDLDCMLYCDFQSNCPEDFRVWT
jgi:hypothetical protein